MRFTLRDFGYPYKSICQGRKQVGRVWQHAETKKWHGMIGKDEATGATATEAFENVASKALGFNNPSEVRENNRRVRAENARNRAAVRQAINELMSGGDMFKAVDRLLGIK